MLSDEFSLHMATMPLEDWLNENEEDSLSVWNRKWTALLEGRNQEGLENHLSSFCFSILDLSEQDQVFVARTVFVSIITDILRMQSKKDALNPVLLVKAYEKIFAIETWENISQFILNITSYVSLVVDELLAESPIYDACPRIDEAMRLIQKQIGSRDLTVKWLAEQLEISTTHLSNLFRLKVGMNVSDYIAKRKVTEIAYDIVHTSKSLGEIREKYGFVSHSHFIQYFKRHKGKTPLKYRQYVLNMTEND